MRPILISILLFVFSSELFSQQSSVIEKITTDDGLPSNYVFCVEQDTEGYMWIGTDKGLCRFNGAIWEVWDTDRGMPGNYINNIKSDGRNGLWLAISEKGIFHFDCKTKKTRFIINTYLYSLSTTQNGDLIYTIQEKESSNTYEINHQLAKKQLHTIDHSFVGSKNALYKNDSNLKKTSILYLNNKKNIDRSLVKYPHQTNYYSLGRNLDPEKERIINTSYFIIGADFYINTNSDDKKTIYSFNLFQKDLKQIFSAEDSLFTYIGKTSEGFYSINNKTNEAIFYNENNGLSSNNVNHLFKGSDGNLYISTLGGGINILPLQKRNHFEALENPIRNIQINKDHYLGLANGILYTFNKDNVLEKTFTVKDALSFYKNDKQLLIGSFKGLHFYELKNGKAIFQKTLPLTAGISSILPYKDKWLLSSYGNGFYIAKGDIERISQEAYPFGNIEKTIALKNSFAALSFEKGLYFINSNFDTHKSFTINEGLLSNYITDVIECKDSLWVGGKNGVSIIHNDRVVKSLSYKDGFKGTKVIKLFAWQNEVIYIVSDAYIHVYTNGKLKIVGSQLISAYKNDFIKSAVYNDSKQELIIATSKSLSAINLFSLLPANDAGAGEIVEAIVDRKKTNSFHNFTISYKHDNISFRCKPLSGLLFNRSVILYKLNDNDWEKVTDSLIISFKQLRWGDYKLYLKTVNADGIEGKPMLAASFTVLKPWWLQWWFIIIMAFALTILAYQVIQYFNKRKYEKKLQELKLQQELEVERQRISRDLHDNMGAYTSALIANVQQLKVKLGQNEELTKMQSNAAQILESLRETIWVLNNKDITVQEFSDSFKNYCLKILKNFEHINFKATEVISANKKITANEAIHLNKILQEILQNIIKHANATEVIYVLNEEPTLSMSVTDNGKGFDMNSIKRSNGLNNIEWRCKEIRFHVAIESILQNGTTVHIKEQKNA